MIDISLDFGSWSTLDELNLGTNQLTVLPGILNRYLRSRVDNIFIMLSFFFGLGLIDTPILLMYIVFLNKHWKHLCSLIPKIQKFQKMIINLKSSELPVDLKINDLFQIVYYLENVHPRILTVVEWRNMIVNVALQQLPW